MRKLLLLNIIITFFLVIGCTNLFKKDSTAIDIIAEPLFLGGLFTAYVLENTIGQLVPEPKKECLKPYEAKFEDFYNAAFILSNALPCHSKYQLGISQEDIYVTKNTNITNTYTISGSLYKCKIENDKTVCNHFSQFSIDRATSNLQIDATNQSLDLSINKCMSSRYLENIIYANSLSNGVCKVHVIRHFPLSSVH